MSNTFFTSDTHFFHKNILKHADRPFKDIYHMHEVIIEAWNSRVSEGDEVYHLGDLSFGNTELSLGLLARLNGRIHLILGNHDKKPERFRRYILSIQSYAEIKIGDQKLCLFHYPILSWNKAHRGSWHLHGHCHFNLKENPNSKRMDVGIDNPRCKWGPIDFNTVGEYMETIKEYIPLDHHV